MNLKGIGQLLLKLKVAIRLLKLVICSKIMKGFIVGLLINHLVTFKLRKTKHLKIIYITPGQVNNKTNGQLFMFVFRCRTESAPLRIVGF